MFPLASEDSVINSNHNMPAHTLSIAFIAVNTANASDTTCQRRKKSYHLMKPIVDIHPLVKILRRLPPQVFFQYFICDVFFLPSSYSTCLYQARITCSVEVCSI